MTKAAETTYYYWQQDIFSQQRANTQIGMDFLWKDQYLVSRITLTFKKLLCITIVCVSAPCLPCMDETVIHVLVFERNADESAC